MAATNYAIQAGSRLKSHIGSPTLRRSPALIGDICTKLTVGGSGTSECVPRADANAANLNASRPTYEAIVVVVVYYARLSLEGTSAILHSFNSSDSAMIS